MPSSSSGRTTSITVLIMNKRRPRKLSSQPVTETVDPFRRWWRNSPLFALEESSNRAKPRPGLDDAFRWFWEANRIPAWAYELVRRLPKTAAPLAQEELRIISGMPAYVDLELPQRQAIRAAVHTQFHWPEKVLNPKGANLQKLGFTEPMPPWSFRLDTSLKTVRKLAETWFRQQRDQPALRCPGRDTSRNRAQDQKLGDWGYVEGLETSAKAAEPNRRKYALKQANRFVGAIIGAWQVEAIVPVEFQGFPSIPGVSDNQFALKQFQKLLSAHAAAKREASVSLARIPLE